MEPTPRPADEDFVDDFVDARLVDDFDDDDFDVEALVEGFGMALVADESDGPLTLPVDPRLGSAWAWGIAANANVAVSRAGTSR